jgi:hypothetical protein
MLIFDKIKEVFEPNLHAFAPTSFIGLSRSHIKLVEEFFCDESQIIPLSYHRGNYIHTEYWHFFGSHLIKILLLKLDATSHQSDKGRWRNSM